MKLGYVLSSGGPFGIAHLGVLKRLEEENIRPDIVAGSSVGAIISGLYASGLTVDEMIDLSLNNTFKDMFSDYTIFGVNKNGFGPIKGEKFLKILKEKTENKKFHDVNIPLGMNAVDANTSREVMLTKGSIAEAMRASASIPMLFKPFYLNGKYLIDGSVSNPMPVRIAHKLGADRVIGITFDRGVKTKKAKLDKDLSFQEIVDISFHRLDDNIFGPIKNLLNRPFANKFLSTLFRYLNFDRKLIKHYLNMHNSTFKKFTATPDILIKTNLANAITTEDFIKHGYDQTNLIINDIGSQIDQYRSMELR